MNKKGNFLAKMQKAKRQRAKGKKAKAGHTNGANATKKKGKIHEHKLTKQIIFYIKAKCKKGKRQKEKKQKPGTQTAQTQKKIKKGKIHEQK